MIKIKKNNYFYKNRKILSASVLLFLACFIILTVAINTKAEDNVTEFTLPEGVETVDIIIHTEVDYNGNIQPLSNVGIKVAEALHRKYTTEECEYFKTDEGKKSFEQSMISSNNYYDRYYKDERYAKYLKEEYDEELENYNNEKQTKFSSNYLEYLEENYGARYKKNNEGYESLKEYCEGKFEESFEKYMEEFDDDLFIKYIDEKYPQVFKEYLEKKYSYIHYYDNFDEYYQTEYSKKCDEPEYDYDNICRHDGNDKPNCMYYFPSLFVDKYLNFKSGDNGYEIENLSSSEIKSTQLKTDNSGNLRLSNIPEGKYIIYESELSGNGLAFLGPLSLVVKKTNGTLKAYVVNNNSEDRIQVTKDDESNNIKVNISHHKQNSSDNSNLSYNSCLFVSHSTIYKGGETKFKIEKEMYPPSNKDWEVNLKVYASGDGSYDLTDPYNSTYINSFDYYVEQKYDIDYNTWLKENHKEYYSDYLEYIDEKYNDNYHDKKFDSVEEYCDFYYCERYDSFVTQKIKDKYQDQYRDEFLQYLEQEYGSEVKKIKNYTVEEYCDNRYCESYDDYLLDRYYSSDDYYDKYLQYITEEYSDDYNSYMEGYSLEDYASDKHREYYYDEDGNFYLLVYDELYDSVHEEYLGLLEEEYGEEYEEYNKEHPGEYESVEEYCEKVHNITYDYNFYIYYRNNYSYFHPFYLEYLEEKYNDEYEKYKKEYTLEKYCEERYYNLYESFLRSNYDEYYYEYNYKYFDKLKDEYNQYLETERKEYIDDLTLEKYASYYGYDYYDFLQEKFYHKDYMDYLEEKYGKEYKEYYDKLTSENDKYEHVVLSKKSGNVAEFSNTKKWEYCSDFFSNFRDLDIDIIEESNDYDVKFSSNASGLKQEGNRYYGTIKNAYSHEISVKVTNWDKNYGDLEISKKVFGVDEEEKANREFKFTLTLTAPLASTLLDSYLYTRNGEEKLDYLNFTDGDNSDTKITTITLKDKESIRIIGLPAGTKYKVEEVQEKGYKVSVKNNEGIVPSADLADVLFTNTKAKTGLLTVTKKVVDSNAEKNKARDKEFTFTVTLDNKEINGQYGEMEFKDGVATFTLKDGESKTAINIPENTKYEVTEEPVNGYDVTKEGDRGTIEDGVEKKVLFTNTKTILSPNTSDGILIAFIVIIISLGSLIYFQINKKALM